MNLNQPARAGVSPAHSCRRAGTIATVVLSILFVAAPRLGAQGRELIALDFSKLPLGAPPKEHLQVTGGKLEIVEKDGVHMLRSAEDSTFLVRVPEKIPSHFALEFEFVPKASGWTSGPTELSFEGTRDVSHSEESAHVLWSHNRISVIGGGQAYAGGQIDMPEDLKEEVIGYNTKIRAEFNDGNLTVQTNGRTVFESRTAKFLRGRVVRVQLGGNVQPGDTDEDENAVYLASMRLVALGGNSGTTTTTSGQTIGGLAPPRGQTAGGAQESTGSSNTTHPLSITGIKADYIGNGVAVVTWDPLPVAATYVVLRWNVADPYCCNNMVAPDAAITGTAWQDLGIARAGAYAYRVIGQTADGLVYGQAQFDFSGGGTQASPTGTVATTATTPSPQPAPSTDAVNQAPSTDIVYQPPSSTSPGTADQPTTTADTPTTTSTATGLPRTGGTIIQPDTSTTTTSTTSTPTATGTPVSGTIVQPDGSTAPYSSGRRTVSIVPTEPAPSTDTVYQMPAPSDLPTLDATEPTPAATTEPVTVLMAEPVMQTGTMVGIATVEPAKTDSGTGGGGDASNQMQDATQTSGGGGAPASGRYRVTIAGVSVSLVTKDDILNLDGMGNEVFAAAAVVNWNRQTGQLTGFSFAQTRDYGDIGNGTMFGNRIKAGTASMNGGLVAGNNVPGSFDPKGAVSLLPPSSDQLPLLVWEGTLTAGVEAIVVAPSLWEHDVARTQLTLYRQNWTKASPSMITSAKVVADQMATSTIAPTLAPLSLSVAAAPPAPTFSGLPTDGYKMAIQIFPPGEDRPIGMGSGGPGVVTYREQIVVITQEKLASLAVGAGTTFALPFAEPNDLFLGGIYTLYVRVERTQ